MLAARRARRLLGLGRTAERSLIAPSARTLAEQDAAVSGDEGGSGRRLAEMAAGGWGRADPSPSPPSSAWPSTADAARWLRAGSGGLASATSEQPRPSSPPPPAALPTLPWRDAVALARAAGLDREGADPLVDSFG